MSGFRRGGRGGFTALAPWLMVVLACDVGASAPSSTAAGRNQPPSQLAAGTQAPSTPTAGDDPAAALFDAFAAAREARGLPAPAHHPVLDQVARDRVARVAREGPTSAGVTATTGALHRLGYVPWFWRDTSVCCDVPASAFRAGTVAFDPELVGGEWEHAASACAAGPEGQLCLLLVALPRLTIERRQSEQLADRALVRAEILAAVNTARSEAGRPPLTADPGLDAIAQAHAEDMLARDYYDHTSPEGKRPSDRLTAAGWRYRQVAENIAHGLFTPAV